MTLSLNLRLAIASHYSEQARSRWMQCSQVAWNDLVQEATVNRLAPLLYHSLTKFPRIDVPDVILDHLRTVYYATAARNMQMHVQLKRVTDALDEIGVRYILLKGAALIQDVYEGNMGLRPMGDLDILVDSKDFPTAREKLISCFDIDPSKLDIDFISHHLKVRPTKDVLVELHSRLIGFEFFADIISFDLLWGRQSVGLSAPQQFVHLCAHNYLHHNKSIPHFGADAGFVSAQVQDWSQVIDFAAQHSMMMPLKWGMNYVSTNWFGAIPTFAFSELSKANTSIKERFYTLCLANPALKVFIRWWALPNIRLKSYYAWRFIYPKI